MNLADKTDKELWDMLDKIDDEILTLEQDYDTDKAELKDKKHKIYREIIRREKGE